MIKAKFKEALAGVIFKQNTNYDENIFMKTEPIGSPIRCTCGVSRFNAVNLWGMHYVHFCPDETVYACGRTNSDGYRLIKENASGAK